MNRRRAFLIGLGGAGLLGFAGIRQGRAADLNAIRQKVLPRLQRETAAKGLTVGLPVFMRIFKEERELEVWLRPGPRFELFKTYPICTYSGDLGPKLAEGDGQSPEGFYFVTPERMNPASSYHLSFDLGFPNSYDKARGRTGSFLMVHGACVSVGCYAMTDPGIEEIYLLAEAAFDRGQRFFRVHAFPFRMTDEALAAHAGSPWVGFWHNLAEGNAIFEETGLPPDARVSGSRYVFAPTS